MIDNLKKSYETPSLLPNVIQDVRKRDDKARTFAPPDNTIELSEDDWKELLKLERSDDSLKSNKNKSKKFFSELKRPKDLEMDKIFKDMNKYEDINLNVVNNLISDINDEITEGDNIVDIGDGEKIYFRDLTDFLYDIKDGKINNFNNEREYEKRLKNTEIKLANRKKFSKFTGRYEQYINVLKRLLFTEKSSGRGLTISSLPILLSKMYTNNSSKELINDIKQLVKNLYDNKQITRQVYNTLNKALMSTTFLKNDS